MEGSQAAIRTRDAGGQPVSGTALLQPAQTAVLVIDLWDYHWCRTWCGRAEALARRILAALRSARRMGMTVIHAPTNFVAAYAGCPQRERAAAFPECRSPSPFCLTEPPYDKEFRLYRTDIPELPRWPGDMCGAPYGCTPNYGGNALLPWLEIEPEDYICADGQEVYNLCRARGIDTLIYTGGAANMCLLAKPEGLVNMTTTDLHCFLARDLTEAYSTGADSAALDAHTRESIAYIERWLCPSLDFGALVKAELPRFVLVQPWGLAERPQLFDCTTAVSLSAPDCPGAQIRYTLDGSDVCDGSPAADRLEIRDTCMLQAAAFFGKQRISEVTRSFYRRLPPIPPPPDLPISGLPLAFGTQKGYVSWWNEGRPDTKTGPVRNRSWDGSPLLARGRRYANGIGVDTPSQLVFAIPKGSTLFTARAALCESDLERNLASETAAYAEAVFRIFVDGCLAQESLPMHLGDEPWRFAVPLPPTAGRISLVTQTREPGRSCNLANWLEAGFRLPQDSTCCHPEDTKEDIYERI